MKRINFSQNRGTFISRFVIVFAIVVLILFMIGTIKEYVKRTKIDKEAEELKKELANLRMDKNNFLQSLDEYKNDFYVEQEAREKFNLKKPGEEMVIIPTPEIIQNNKGQNQSNENIKETNNLKAWWRYFFDQAS